MAYEDIKVETALIVALSSTEAECQTVYGGIVRIPWANGLPDDMPKVGELWLIEQIGQGIWRFDSKMNSGECNVLHYAMKVDAQSCVGKERVVVDDIYKSGVDEAYVIVAKNGVVMWDSVSAEDYGLDCYGDRLSQLINRFDDYSMPVTLVIDAALWTGEGSSYHQQYYVQGVDGYELKESQCTSPSAAFEPLDAFIKELYSRYPFIKGIVLDRFGVESQYGDFSDASRVAYYDRYHKVPDVQCVIGDIEDRIDWIEHLFSEQRLLLSKLIQSNPGVPISILAGKGAFSDEDGGKYIDDDISMSGISMTGMPVDFEQYSDRAASWRSFEYLTALIRRFAKYSAPLYELDLRMIDEYDAPLEILAKYDANTVLLNDYEYWKLLSDESIIALDKAMDKYRVTEKDMSDTIGVYMSSWSRRSTYNHSYLLLQWYEAFSNICAALMDKSPHRLEIIFDSDVRNHNIQGASALLTIAASNLDDDAIEYLSSFVDTATNIVFAGRTGYKEWQSSDMRSTAPLYDLFTPYGVYGATTYQRELRMPSAYKEKGKPVESPAIDFSTDVYELDESVQGDVVVMDYGDEDEGDCKTYRDDDLVTAPVFFNKRSSIIGMDVFSPIFEDVVSDFVMYAIGRDA